MFARRALSYIVILLGISIFSPASAQTSPKHLKFPSASIRQKDLLPTDGEQFSFFGNSVAISGNTVVVGSPGYADDDGDAAPGHAYVYVKPPGGWTNMVQTAELTASDGGSDPGNNFGTSVAIADDTIFVGAPATLLGSFPNRVYIFSKPPDGWHDMTETAIVSAGTSMASYGFGESVAVDSTGETLVVGAEYAQLGLPAPQGAVYVFVKPPNGWQNDSSPDALLMASDASANDRLGRSVAIDGDTVVAGADNKLNGTGEVYVYAKPPGGWTNMTETAQLTAAVPVPSSFLGTSVGISGDTIVAGAPEGSRSRPTGRVYVFVEPPGGWSNTNETAQLIDPSRSFDSLGWSVAMTSRLIVAGAPAANVNGNQGQGGIYIFAKPKDGWKSASKFAAFLDDEFGEVFDGFGTSVAIDGNTVAAGAPEYPAGEDVGRAYVFVGR